MVPILEELFPEMASRDADLLGFRRGSEADPTEYRRARRLTHPDCFPSYFTLKVPETLTADSTVHRLIDDWNSDGQGAKDQIKSTFETYAQQFQLSELLRKLLLFVESFDHNSSRSFLAAVIEFSLRLHTSGWQSEMSRATALFLSVVESHIELNEIQSTIESAVRRAPALTFVVHLVLSCHKSQGGPWRKVFSTMQIETLRQAARERLRREYIEDRQDILAELPQEDWGFILYQWATNWMTDSSAQPGEVNSYILSLIEGNPSYLGLVLTRFFEEREYGDSFEYARFRQMYDGAEFEKRLAEDFDRYTTVDSARKAAHLFLDVHRRSVDSDNSKANSD